MPTHLRPVPRRRGFTLLEIVIVVAIIGIVSILGIGSINRLLPRYRTRHAALQFATHADQLRTMAIVQNVEYRIQMADFDPYATDPNTMSVGTYVLQRGNLPSKSTNWVTLEDGVGSVAVIDFTAGVSSGTAGRIDFTDNGEDEIPGVSLADWGTLAGPTAAVGADSNQDCVVFSPRGWVTNPNEDFSHEGYIQFEFVNKKALLDEVSQVYQVRIARSGFARVDFKETSLYADVSGNPMGIDATTTTNSSSSGTGGGGSAL